MIKIRYFQPGDEVAQLEIYNQAAAALPRFKPATLGEIQRRTRARDFDPSSRFYAEVGGRVVGYAISSPNGRVSFPWTLPGHEQQRGPLFQALLIELEKKGVKRLFAAYREDWPLIHQFFHTHGFRKARDMVNFAIDLGDMPTPAARPSTTFTPLVPEDVPAVLKLAPEILRIHDPAALERYLFHNPYFPADSLYTLRSRADQTPLAVGIMINDMSYADCKVVDSNLPCFRLGAFGTEGMQAKRIKGLFSFLAKQDRNMNLLGMDLLGQASFRLRDSDDIETLAAQAPSDAPALLNFYSRIFQRQGSFPVFELER